MNKFILKDDDIPGGGSLFSFTLSESVRISMDKSFDFFTELGTFILTSTSSMVCDHEYFSVLPPLKQSDEVIPLDAGADALFLEQRKQ